MTLGTMASNECLIDDEGGRHLAKNRSEDSLASLEDSSLQEKSIDGDDGVTLANDTADNMELPSGVEEVEVQGEGEQPQDDWMDIIGSGDLKKKVLEAGIVETRPVRGDTVCVELTMRLSDGTLVEDTHTLYFTLGDCEVIQGLDLVVPLMDRGELSEVYIHSRFAYGSKGDEGRVPCDMALLCTVRLVDFRPEESPDTLTVTDRQQIGNRKRVRGNWWFNRGDYCEAVQCYKAAVDFLDDTEDLQLGEELRTEVRVLLEERLKALNNMAAAQIKLGALEAALASVKAVLDCQPDNVKALFRQGKALALQGQARDAFQPLRRALELEPDNKAVRQELSKLSQQARVESESEKSLYRRMLGLKKQTPAEQSRYPTLKTFPWRVFTTSFMTIVVALVAYSYRDALSSFLKQ